MNTPNPLLNPRQPAIAPTQRLPTGRPPSPHVPLWVPVVVMLSLLTSCVTTTVTKPDGSVVKTTSQDPAVVEAVVKGVTEGAVAAVAKQNGFAK